MRSPLSAHQADERNDSNEVTVALPATHYQLLLVVPITRRFAHSALGSRPRASSRIQKSNSIGCADTYDRIWHKMRYRHETNQKRSNNDQLLCYRVVVWVYACELYPRWAQWL